MPLFRRCQTAEQRAFAPGATAINDNVRRQFDQLFQMCGEEQTKILYAKWRLDEAGWNPGDIVPRPLSVEEFAQRFIEQLGGGTVEHARQFDASMVEAFQPLVESPFGQSTSSSWPCPSTKLSPDGTTSTARLQRQRAS
jgi:hypothetical protein